MVELRGEAVAVAPLVASVAHKANCGCICRHRELSPTTQNFSFPHSFTTKKSRDKTLLFCGGAKGIRTPDLLNAIQTRYQLRHNPKHVLYCIMRAGVCQTI